MAEKQPLKPVSDPSTGFQPYDLTQELDTWKETAFMSNLSLEPDPWAETARQLGLSWGKSTTNAAGHPAGLGQVVGPANKATICLDRHGPDVQAKTALIWVGSQGPEKQQIVERYTFDQLRRLSNRFANALHHQGIQKGDRVFLFLERIPELYIAMFGALKLGAIVGPLFSAFGPEAIKDRLQDCQARLIVTSPVLKPRIDGIRHELPNLKTVIVVDRAARAEASPTHYADALNYDRLMADVTETPHFTVPPTTGSDGSVIHYTSGTTGKPKGAVHKHQAVVVQAATAKTCLDLKPGDIYWCTADPGWVTGTAYGMFGPWALGCTQLVYEGHFSADNWYKTLQDYGVTVWYTSPTAIRMLMKAGEGTVKQYDLSKLRHMASVGEPLNPEAFHWGEKAFGLPFHDTWWQTETGAIQISNYPGLEIRPGSMGKPLPGVFAGILADDWTPLPDGEEGHLALRPTAPSLFKTYWGREDLYQSRFKNGWYITGDRAKRDADGYYWFIGRADDVINTAGHLVGPFEVESALIEHPAVAEAGVIGIPDPERMEVIKAFVSLKTGFSASDELKKDIQQFVRTRLAAHAYPREIGFLDSLPKTRSGKIMRRLLKTRELGLPEGDTSTLED